MAKKNVEDHNSYQQRYGDQDELLRLYQPQSDAISALRSQLRREEAIMRENSKKAIEREQQRKKEPSWYEKLYTVPAGSSTTGYVTPYTYKTTPEQVGTKLAIGAAAAGLGAAAIGAVAGGGVAAGAGAGALTGTGGVGAASAAAGARFLLRYAKSVPAVMNALDTAVDVTKLHESGYKDHYAWASVALDALKPGQILDFADFLKRHKLVKTFQRWIENAPDFIKNKMRMKNLIRALEDDKFVSCVNSLDEKWGVAGLVDDAVGMDNVVNPFYNQMEQTFEKFNGTSQLDKYYQRYQYQSDNLRNAQHRRYAPEMMYKNEKDETKRKTLTPEEPYTTFIENDLSEFNLYNPYYNKK